MKYLGCMVFIDLLRLRRVNREYAFLIVFTKSLSSLSHLRFSVNNLPCDFLRFGNSIFWVFSFREGNHPDDYSRLTYRKLLEEVCRFANVLKMHGVNKGDRVSIYMPMVMELPIAMLACARIGAVHSIVVS